MTLFIYVVCGTVVSYLAPPNFDYKGSPLREDYKVQAELTFGVVVPLVFGFTILVLAYATAPYEAGQLNPSVSIALLVSHKQGLVQTILMICVQLLGSLTAVGLLSATVPNIQDSRYGANYLSPKVTQGNAVMGESVATFLLVIVVLQVISQKNAATIAPIAIGFAVLIAHFLLLAIDGCSINPARSFGPAVASGHWDDFWVFVVGPISGALFAAAAHSLIAARQEVQEEVEKDLEAQKPRNVKTDSV